MWTKQGHAPKCTIREVMGALFRRCTIRVVLLYVLFTPIQGQGQGHQPPKVGNLVIYKMHLLRKFNSNSGFVYRKRLLTNMSTKWSKRFLIRFVVWAVPKKRCNQLFCVIHLSSSSGPDWPQCMLLKYNSNLETMNFVQNITRIGILIQDISDSE